MLSIQAFGRRVEAHIIIKHRKPDVLYQYVQEFAASISKVYICESHNVVAPISLLWQ